MYADAAELLERVPGWEGHTHVGRVLDGGITNRNYLVTVDGSVNQYVLRVAGAETHLLEIDREREREATLRAATLGIAPDVVAWIEPEGCLVTRFVAGAHLTRAEVADPRYLSDVVHAIRIFHDSGPLCGDFDAFTVPLRHRDTAIARGVVLPPELDHAVDAAARIHAAFRTSPEPPVAAHNDLLNGNFIVDASQHKVWLLDWEYAGNNDRYFDLGNLAVNNEFDNDAEVAMIEAYFGEVTERHPARVALMKMMSDFREAMWGVVQQAISTLDFDYEGYAVEHLERMLAAASSPEYLANLDAAGER